MGGSLTSPFSFMARSRSSRFPDRSARESSLPPSADRRPWEILERSDQYSILDPYWSRWITPPPSPAKRAVRPRAFATPSPWAQARATARSRMYGHKLLSEVIDVKSLPARSFACARRGIRRQVLFALRNTGRGAGAVKRRRSRSSSYRCR